MTGCWGTAESVSWLKVLAAAQLQLGVTLPKRRPAVVQSPDLSEEGWNPDFYGKFPNLQMLATHSIQIFKWVDETKCVRADLTHRVTLITDKHARLKTARERFATMPKTTGTQMFTAVLPVKYPRVQVPPIRE